MHTIRQWMTLCEKMLSEAQRMWVSDTVLWKNPNIADLKRLLKASAENRLRGLLLGDLYVWDAYYGVHAGIQDELDLHQAIKLTLYSDTVEISYRDDPNPDTEIEDDEKYIAAHPAIIRAYGYSPNVWSSAF